jgi:hypothetical protein
MRLIRNDKLDAKEVAEIIVYQKLCQSFEL